MSSIQVTAYHGSGVSIDKFSYEWTGRGNDNIGSGWYFTTDQAEAERYATATTNNEPKIGGSETPTLHVVELTLTNPFPVDKVRPLSPTEVANIISKSPDLEDVLNNFGDVQSDGVRKVLNNAVKPYSNKKSELIVTLNQISNDFFDGHIEEFNKAVRNTIGYDGTYEQFEDKTHYVAWFKDQIKIIERIQVEPCENTPPARPNRVMRRP